MSKPQRLVTKSGRSIAYHHSAGQGPGVVFLGGFTSDMTGSKASYLEEWSKNAGRAFLRFDYSGHGSSSGNLHDGCISDWAEDAAAVISAVTMGPQILVGSSMGGWISLLLARQGIIPVAGFVGIAAAPDFTNTMRAAMPPAEVARLQQTGRGFTPDSGPDGVVEVWTRLLDDPQATIFAHPLSLPFPVRLLHGTDDADVPISTALRLLDHAQGPDIHLTLVKGAGHRFSTPDCLALIAKALDDVSQRAQASITL